MPSDFACMQDVVCGHWNRVSVNKIFLEQPSPEPKVQVLVPMYEPLEVTNACMHGMLATSSQSPDFSLEPSL